MPHRKELSKIAVQPAQARSDWLTTRSSPEFAQARSDWLATRSSTELFVLAQLLVSTIDIRTKTPPRTIRGLLLNKSERALCDSFQRHMRAALGRSGE
jgi:hypothetical protein